MSSTVLYHIQGIRQYKLKRFVLEKGKNIFEIEHRHDSDLCCPACGSKNVVRKGSKARVFTGVPLKFAPSEIRVKIPRIHCKNCGKIGQIHIEFACPNVRYTRFFEAYALTLLSHMTCKDAAALCRVSWDTMKEIDKRNLKKRFSNPSLKGVTQIAIDEIAVKKGHKYVTLVLDLETRRVLHVGDGRGADSLKEFWKRLKRRKVRIKCVATDLSPACTKAVRENLPKANHVFDRFHITQLFNKTITSCRRAIYKELTEAKEKQALKGCRFILLKRRNHLDPTRREPERLEKALTANADLSQIYFLKEELSQFWQQTDLKTAKGYLYDWLERAESLKISSLTKFCQTIRDHLDGLFSWYTTPISTGPLEGINNKIKTLKRQSYGFRDSEYFRLKILGIHRSRYALVG